MRKKLQLYLAGALFLLVLAGGAHATVLDFENVPGADSSAWGNAISNGYGGFNWENMFVVHKDFPDPPPNSFYENGVVSGEWVAYNNFPEIAVVSDSMFDFIGAYFTSAYWTADTLEVKGYKDGSELYAATIDITNSAATWAHLNFTGIDQLTFASTNTYFAMDDFTFDKAAPVPEPSTFFLLGAGLGGLAWARRKRG